MRDAALQAVHEDAAGSKFLRQAAARRTVEKGKGIARVPTTRQKAAAAALAQQEAADVEQAKKNSLRDSNMGGGMNTPGAGSSKDAMSEGGADALALMPPIPVAPVTVLSPAPARPAAATAAAAATEAAAASTVPASGGPQAAAAAASGHEPHAQGALHIAVHHR